MSVEVCAECDIAECHHIRARRAEEAKHPTTLVAMVPLHYHLAAVAEAEARGVRRAAEIAGEWSIEAREDILAAIPEVKP